MKKIYLLLVSVLPLCCGQFAAAQTSGSGTTDYVPLWTNSTTLGNSKIYQTGGNVGVGTTSPQWALDVAGHINTSSAYKIGDLTVLAQTCGVSYYNIAVGYQALPTCYNTGWDTAVGDYALYSDRSDGTNTAVGFQALYNSTYGDSNTSLGYQALMNNTGGSGNIAIGSGAAFNVSGTNSNNIHIGSFGSSSDNGTIRIGISGTQTSFFVVGVRGVTTGESNAVPVVIDSNGQLGTVSSSRRFKEDIQDMGSATEGLMRLRPVTFRYQKPFANGSKPIQYGLIAEEVAEVYPELVAHSADGQVESVMYQYLDSMLLNEVQRQHAQIQGQQAEIQRLQDRLAKMEAALASLSHKPEDAAGETAFAQK